MDFKKLLNMFDGATEKQILNENKIQSTEEKKSSLKDVFETISGQKPIPVVGKEGGTQQTGAGFVNVTDPALQGLGKTIGDLAAQKKVQIVVPTAGQQSGQKPQSGQPAQGGATGQAPAGQTQVKEKWGTETKVAPSEKGKYAGKTKAELTKQYNALKDSGPHKKGSKEYGRMRELAFAIRAKSGWGKVQEEGEEMVDEKAKNPYAIGMAAAKKAAGITAKHAHDLPKSVVVKGHEIAKKIKDKKDESIEEADIPSTQGVDTMGAGLGAGRSNTTLEGKKIKKVEEGMNHRINAARLEGHSHGLKGHSHCGKNYDDVEESRAYHEGYKQGLDECYGMGVYEAVESTSDEMDEAAGSRKLGPVAKAALGLADEAHVPSTVHGMADQALEDEMDEGNAFTAALAKTPKGGKFSVGGKTFTDTSSYDSTLDEYAFESLDKQLNALLNEDATSVAEGLNVSMSQGQSGMHGDQLDDSVSVSATGDDAAKLLAFIKQVGIGSLGGDNADAHTDAHPVAVASDYGAPKFTGHDDMKSLIAKVSGDDYASEEDTDVCPTCKSASCGCGGETEVVDEVETEDQMTYQVAEDNPPDSDQAETTADEDAEAAEDAALAKADVNEGGDGGEGAGSDAADAVDAADSEEEEEESLSEWANDAGGNVEDDTFTSDIDFMTKVISGGLNKQKSTGQTTIPVIAHQGERVGVSEDSVGDWKKLAGIN